MACSSCVELSAICVELRARIEELEQQLSRVSELERQLVGLQIEATPENDTVVVDGDDVGRGDDDIHGRAEKLAAVIRALESKGYLHFIVFTTHNLASVMGRFADVRPNEIMWKQLSSYTTKEVVERAVMYNCAFLTSVEIDNLRIAWDVTPNIRRWLCKNRSSVHLSVCWDALRSSATIVSAADTGCPMIAAETMWRTPPESPSAHMPFPPAKRPPPGLEDEVVPPPGLDLALPRTLMIRESEEYCVKLVEHQGQFLVCFQLERDAVSNTLAQGSSEVACYVVGDANNFIENEDEDVPNLKSEEPWAVSHQIITVTTGKYSGLRAIGMGTNAKVRRRAARLAVSIAALACTDARPMNEKELPSCEEIMQIAAQVRLALPREAVANESGPQAAPERTKSRAGTSLAAPRPPAPGLSQQSPAHTLQRAPPPPAGPPRSGVPAPPPGRPPLFSLIGPQLPPPVPANAAPVIPPVKPPLPTLGPPAVTNRETVQTRPQPPTRSAPEVSGVVRSGHPFLPEDRSQAQLPPQPQFPPPQIEADWYAPSHQSASEWLDAPSTIIDETSRTREAPTSVRTTKTRLPPAVPARPVPLRGLPQVGPNMPSLHGRIATVLCTCDCESPGYLVLAAGDRVLIKCNHPELGDRADKFEHYIYGKKMSGSQEEGWFPYNQDLIKLEENC